MSYELSIPFTRDPVGITIKVWKFYNEKIVVVS